MKQFNFSLLILFFASLIIGCQEIKNPLEEEKTSTFLFLYTNDEHGHIYEKESWYKGSVLYEMWADEEKSCKECMVFKISGGDNFTGSAVSSFFEGAPVAEIMEITGYKFSALGNHEFDFGTAPFERNRAVSSIEYISSNVISSDMKTPFPPSVIYKSNEGIVSFIGSTTEELKQISFASYLKNMKVVKPEGPVGRELVKNESISDFQVLLTHESSNTAKDWVLNLKVKPLIVFSGHEHVEIVKNYNDTLFIQTAGKLDSYARVIVEKRGKSIKVTQADIIPLKKDASFSSDKSKKIKNIIDGYLEKLEKKAGQKLINSKKNFEFEYFQKLYACSLLKYFPEYDVAMSNPGAFRDKIVAGDLKKSDIISMLPFQNRIVLSTIKGSDMIYNLNLSSESYCGVKKIEEKWFVKNNEIEADRKYSAVIHEYIYNGGDYYKFITEDAENSITSKDWREPLEYYLIESSKKGLDLQQAYNNIIKHFNR